MRCLLTLLVVLPGPAFAEAFVRPILQGETGPAAISYALAAVGLVVNLMSMKLLSAGSSESLNVQGAYFEVLSDMLGSLGVIAAALIIMYTGWTIADPIIGAGIGVGHRADIELVHVGHAHAEGLGVGQLPVAGLHDDFVQIVAVLVGRALEVGRRQ